MKRLLLVALACMMLAVSACAIEPYNGGNARGHFYGGGDYEHDYSRPVWRQ